MAAVIATITEEYAAISLAHGASWSGQPSICISEASSAAACSCRVCMLFSGVLSRLLVLLEDLVRCLNLRLKVGIRLERTLQGSRFQHDRHFLVLGQQRRIAFAQVSAAFGCSSR